LNRGPGNKHPLIAPEVPTGGLIGQAVFDHQTDRHSHNAVGVVALGQGHVRHVGVKVDVAFGAMMDGVRKMDVVRAARDQVPQVVQHPLRSAMPIGTVFALWTWLPSEIPTAFDDLRLGQVLHTSDALGGIGQVFSRSWHGMTLLGNALQALKLPAIRRRVIIKTQ
jgi:hypothetical protein